MPGTNCYEHRAVQQKVSHNPLSSAAEQSKHLRPWRFLQSCHSLIWVRREQARYWTERIRLAVRTTTKSVAEQMPRPDLCLRRRPFLHFLFSLKENPNYGVDDLA